MTEDSVDNYNICFTSNGHSWVFRRKKHKNYWYLYIPNYFSADKSGSVREHIYFYQEYHKVCVLKWAVVHHIDHVTPTYCNNMIWNLETMMRGEHVGMHKKGNKNGKKDMSNRFCLLCGITQKERKDIIKNIWYRYENGLICRRCYRRKRPLQAPNLNNI